MFVINNIASIQWGTGYANTAIFEFPADDCTTYVQFNDDFELGQSLGGTDISFIMAGDAGGSVSSYPIMGRSAIWEGTLRWIPATDTALATGWDGVTGIRAMLEWARRKNPLRITFKPFTIYTIESTPTFVNVYVTAPLEGGHELEPDGTRSIRLTLKSSDGLLFNGISW